jgi:ribosomal protein S4E
MRLVQLHRPVHFRHRLRELPTESILLQQQREVWASTPSAGPHAVAAVQPKRDFLLRDDGQVVSEMRVRQYDDALRMVSRIE